MFDLAPPFAHSERSLPFLRADGEKFGSGTWVALPSAVATDDEQRFRDAETTPVPIVAHRKGEEERAMSERADRVGFMGSGLSGAMLSAIIAVSTAAFLFWGGPLWRATPGASHVGRIGGSYLIVIPLVLSGLALARRSSVGHFLGSVGIVWSTKLLITATAYSFLARGSATEYAPARPWDSGRATPSDEHRATPTPTRRGHGILSGEVVASGAPVSDAAIVIGDFEAATPDRVRRDVRLVIAQSRYDKPVYLSSSDGHIVLENKDALLHTLRVTKAERAVANVPIPPRRDEHSIPSPEPGSYLLSCENHASEHALLVVVDHPLATITDSNGRYELRGVPTDREAELSVLRRGNEPVHRTFRAIDDQQVQLSIEVP